MFNNLKYKFWLFATLTFVVSNLNAAYLQNVPQKIVQPNGNTIDCFATGDEFYSWLHDKEGYTIIQNPITGFYCYAINKNDSLIATEYIVGIANPYLLRSIKPFTNYSSDKIGSIRRKASDFMFSHKEEHKVKNKHGDQFQAPKQGKINNIVIYISFRDQTEFPAQQQAYTGMFNTNATSLRNYFKEVSYNQLDIESHFYPENNGTTIISYKDSYPRNYYRKYSPSNPQGYRTDNDRTEREHELLTAAFFVGGAYIPTTLNLDGDNDGKVDNICFIIRGGSEGWNELLWPHRWSLYSISLTIDNKRVYDYNFLLENSIDIGTMCHETFHTIGAPDLYH